MTFRLICLCCALVSTTTAFGQQGQQASVRVNGGTIVGQFIPDGQQITPVTDPSFQQPVVVQQNQHAHNCSCKVCKRTLVGKTKQVFSKTHSTVITTEHFVDEHPVQFFNESPPIRQNPCPPQDPCLQQRQGGGGHPSGGLVAWDNGFRGYRPLQCPPGQQPIRNGFASSSRRNGNLVAVNSGFSLFGFGPQVNVRVGHEVPPYAQSGYSYGGNHPWYGGR